MLSFEKRIAKGLLGFLLFSVVMAVLMAASGCASVPAKPAADIPPGCETSVLYAHAPYSFIALDAGRVALQIALDPAQYKLAQMAARSLAMTLENDRVTMNQVKELSGWEKYLIPDLAKWFPPGKIIGVCDREALIGYLKEF